VSAVPRDLAALQGRKAPKVILEAKETRDRKAPLDLRVIPDPKARRATKATRVQRGLRVKRVTREDRRVPRATKVIREN
jgi:hypothetical protein